MMSEAAKTMLFFAIAAAAVTSAVLVTREAPEVTAQSQVGQKLVNIDHPQNITSLKIVRFDESTGETKPFEVARSQRGFTIPSHEHYPADQAKHLADAATSVNGVEILASAGEGRKSFEDFGVIDPTDSSLKLGASGVGMRVTLGDAKGSVAADFIVGKDVADRPGLRYVRRADQDQVYVVKLDSQYLSTRFEDWIEKDLLKIDPLDLKQVQLADYTVKLESKEVQVGDRQMVYLDPKAVKRSMTTLSYDSQALKWVPNEMLVFKDDQATPVKIAADEELNEQKLNDMKNALQDLKIADVRRKPPGMSGDIVDFFKKNDNAEKTLLEGGFYPKVVDDAETGAKSIQILSGQGEVLADMNDGVEYVLRFGNVAGGQSAGEQAANQKEKDKKQSRPQGTKLLRYLWVVTRYNPNLIPKPVLKPVPSLVAPPAGGDAGGHGAPKAEPAKKDRRPADAASTSGKESGKKTGLAATPPAGAADAHGPPEAAGKSAAKSAKPKVNPAKEAEARKKQHDLILKENEQAQKEYDERVAAGKQRAAKLNERFDDWYYVIADDVYQKIHLSRADVIRKKPPKTNLKPSGPPGPPDFSLPPGLVPGGGPPGAGPGGQ